MRKKRVYIAIIVLVFLFTACKSNSQSENSKVEISKDRKTENTATNEMEAEEFLNEKTTKPDIPELDLSSQYTVTRFNVNEDCMSGPSGIVCRDKDILVTDKDNNCIKIFNYDGELIHEIGQLGNGELEFISPTGITQDNGLIYVIDSGNKRITILNEDLTYKSNIAYNEELNKNLDIYAYFTSIAILNDKIYLSGYNTLINQIWCFDKQGKQYAMDMPEFAGVIYYDSKYLYAFDTFEVVGLNKRNGVNQLYKIKEDKIIDTIEMPYGLGVNDFIVREDKIYTISCTFASVEGLDMKGNFTGTVGCVPFNNKNIYSIAMDKNENMYVANGTAIIYRIEKKNKN